MKNTIKRRLRVHLRLYENIYTNFWYVGDTDYGFSKKVNDIQESLRIIWVNIENSYLLIPKTYRRILKKMGLIPNREELDCTLKNLMEIHNSSIIYRSENDKIASGHEDLNRRNLMIKEVNEFINRYILNLSNHSIF